MIIFGMVCFAFGAYIGIGGWLAAHLVQEDISIKNLILILRVIATWPRIVRTSEN